MVWGSIPCMLSGNAVGMLSLSFLPAEAPLRELKPGCEPFCCVRSGWLHTTMPNKFTIAAALPQLLPLLLLLLSCCLPVPGACAL